MNEPVTTPAPAPVSDAKPLNEAERRLHFRGLLITAGLCFSSGMLLTLCFPHADLGFLAYAAMIPFLRTFPYAKSRAAFGFGAFFGLSYIGGVIYWIAVFTGTKIGALGYVAWLILSGREALWIGLFSVLTNLVWARPNAVRLVAVPSFWILCEWARQLGPLGFGWCDLGYTQWHLLPIIQIAGVTGLWGVSWLIVFVNTALTMAKRETLIAAAAAILLVSGYGLIMLHRPAEKGDYFTASALQSNIDEDVPYSGNRPADPDYFDSTLGAYSSMARNAHQQDGSALCVTAETSIPGYPRFDPVLSQMLGNIASENQVVLISGAHDIDAASGKDMNSVFAYTPDGRLTSSYNKEQLVPYGEYAPFHQLLPILDKFNVLLYDQQPGTDHQAPLDAGALGKAGVAVCYESTYPRFLRQQVNAGANFDVVVTYDAWFGRTPAARQHMAMSALRAVETDRYLVRAAETGISAIFSPTGQDITDSHLFKPDIVSARIQSRSGKTIFVRFGDWFVYLCAVGALTVLVTNMRRREDLHEVHG